MIRYLLSGKGDDKNLEASSITPSEQNVPELIL